MKLAVTFNTEDGSVYRQFENAKVIKIYSIAENEIVGSELVGTMAENVRDIIGVITMMEADGVLCGDIAPETIELLDSEGITLYSGFYGDADEAVSDLINGYVVFGPDD